MDRAQLLLGKTAEEAIEVVEEAMLATSRLSKLALKAQQFGLNEVCHGQFFTNAERMHKELDHLTASIEMLNKEYNFGYTPDRDCIEEKKDIVNEYAQYSVHLGRVTS